ncbi:uncharacterized protein BYT42DRAFT_610753 [Radiomyces spectabilis]|uniref:uncharacterized protein n=1 Tax=Radiomyces spectabilis TaxID=64574 RepID=UPI00221EC379|nr:uncharacterized protein BYT42DRAFT_610753 [Radiomyces spectabilis]KAI8391537.1 hypothetical protein BYT42DRAFT_610753 [Radiomyces spectabilis]
MIALFLPRLSDEIKKRRRRVRAPVFGRGSIQVAKDWLIEYKSVTDHLKFTERERLDDMEVRFKSVTLTWYNCLLPEKNCIPFHAGAGHIPFERCHNTRSLHSTRHIRATAKLREINNKDVTKHWATLVIFVTVLQRQWTVTPM